MRPYGVGIGGILGVFLCIFVVKTIPVPIASVQSWEHSDAIFAHTISETYHTPSLPVVGDVRTVGIVTTNSDHVSIVSGDTETLTDMVHTHDSTSEHASSSAAFGLDMPEYALIPGGLATIPVEKVRTPQQQKLYEYGNAIGAKLHEFEVSHPAILSTIKDQIDHPADSAARHAVESLADEYASLGHALALYDAPPEITSIATQLSVGYVHMAEKLTSVPRATTDTERVHAMLAYDTAADDYIRAVVGLANMFSAYDVSFGDTDPGKVFSFSASQF